MSKYIEVYNNIISTENIKWIEYSGDFYDRKFIIYYKDGTTIDLSNNRFKEDSYEKGKAIDEAYKKLQEILLDNKLNKDYDIEKKE